MTQECRLAAVEEALTPVQLVLRWIEEIHGYDDMLSYIHSLADRQLGDMPMDRLGRAAKENAKLRTRGRPRAEADRAIWRSLVDTIFRAQLVLDINASTQDRLDRHALIHWGLNGYLGLALHGGWRA